MALLNIHIINWKSKFVSISSAYILRFVSDRPKKPMNNNKKGNTYFGLASHLLNII